MDYILSYTDLPKLHIVIAFFLGIFAVIICSERKRDKMLVSGFLMTWLFLDLSCTILTRPLLEEGHIKLIPFWINGIRKSDIMNIFILIPIGFFLPVLNKKIISTALTGLFCTISIEILQYITCTGFFDINDIIMNETGVIIEYRLWKIFNKTICRGHYLFIKSI